MGAQRWNAARQRMHTHIRSNIRQKVMHRIRISLLLLLFPAALAAQDSNWFRTATADVGFTAGERGLRINSTDVDGDGYPDIAVVRSVYQRGDLRVYLNRQRPGS